MASPVSAALQFLRDRLPGRVITPDADTSAPASASAADFTTLTNQPWSSTCWQAPAAYILPESSSEVATALSILKQSGIKFVVRSTGHNPNPGFSSIGDEGVVIDLAKLQRREIVEVNEVTAAESGIGCGNGKIARVGAGNRWGVVYDWLEKQGLSAIGGRDPGVGMGLLVGGGLGAVPNLHGVPSNGLRGVEIVLSDGRIVNANADENADLYRALKGGGSNFGIITRFDLATHPLIPLQYSITLYSPSDYTNINRATVQLQEDMESEPRIGTFTNFNSAFVAVGFITAGDSASSSQVESEGGSGTVTEAFKPFESLDSKMMDACPTTNGTLGSLAKVMAHAAGDEKKKYVRTLTTTPSADLYNDAYNAWRAALDTIPKDAVLHYTIQPVGSTCVREAEKAGGNILGLKAVAQCWWVFTIEWPRESTPEDDAAARNAVTCLVEKVRNAAKSRDHLLPYLCATFASSDQGVLSSYGAQNIEIMKAVSRKYDPDGVFQSQQYGGFLLRDLE
ncbi:6-hydroxy-D-nicotine oxidase [Aspergillus keveii]|uniref:6-hydroxy-D-nicotine oxidase n=1 Tax=Aspergillus keveii TaxID=714993 RepID=A0ABR4FKJ3_9EURO